MTEMKNFSLIKALIWKMIKKFFRNLKMKLNIIFQNNLNF